MSRHKDTLRTGDLSFRKTLFERFVDIVLLSKR